MTTPATQLNFSVIFTASFVSSVSFKVTGGRRYYRFLFGVNLIIIEIKAAIFFKKFLLIKSQIFWFPVFLRKSYLTENIADRL